MSREMVNSGIPWIGEIPKGWKKIRIKHIFEIIGGNGFKEKYQGKICGDYPFYKTSDINADCDYVSASSNYVDSEVVAIENYNIVPVNSIVVSKIGAAMRKNHRKITTCDCCIDNNLQALHPIRAVDDIKYLYYLLKVVNFEWFDNNGTIPSVNNAKLKDLYVPWISFPEQQKIASFLDGKCSEIDEMIALQEKIVEELKAYKQSVITEAVTKGLNPDVPMKDSGIDWIGEIPEHWNSVHFWKVNYIRGRLGWKGLKADEYQEMGYPFLSAFNIIKDKLDWNDVNCISKERYDESPEIKLSLGDILVVKDGAGIGKCARVDSLPKGEATVNSSLAVITPKQKVAYRFEYYYLLSAPFQYVIWFLKIGMGVPHLTQENMRDIIMVCPTIEEQERIADYLDVKCTEIDNLISIKLSKIDSLKEYKKSIIYEYVTGKKEVIE